MDVDPLALQVRLISIEPLRQGQEDGHSVTLEYSHHGDTLIATFHTSPRQFRDDALLPVARDWFHRTCKNLGEATSDWAMTEDQKKALKHPLSSR